MLPFGNSSADTQASAEVGWEVFQVLELRFLCSPGEAACPFSPWRPQWSRDPPAAKEDPMLEYVDG